MRPRRAGLADLQLAQRRGQERGV